eukprot:6252373-Amphidinium_carterae.1
MRARQHKIINRNQTARSHKPLLRVLWDFCHSPLRRCHSTAQGCQALTRYFGIYARQSPFNTKTRSSNTMRTSAVHPGWPEFGFVTPCSGL